MLPLIEPLWVAQYGLGGERYEILSLPAATFLKPQRFDLFTRLYYIRHRRDGRRTARRVYLEGLRAFSPTWKETGKENEKSGASVHIRVFDCLIDRFGSDGFDPEMSLVPVGRDDVILDGSHRISSLAFFCRDVTVCRFAGVEAKHFNWEYFHDRGMSYYVADLATLEAVGWLSGLNVLCVWPGGSCPDLDDDRRLYVRDFMIGAGAYTRLRSILDPSWREAETTEPRLRGKACVRFVFFLPHDARPSLRDTAGDSLLIGDRDEVRKAAELVLTDEGRSRWYGPGTVSGWLAVRCWRLKDHLHAESVYCQRRIKIFLSNIHSGAWIAFYRMVSPLWKGRIRSNP